MRQSISVITTATYITLVISVQSASNQYGAGYGQPGLCYTQQGTPIRITFPLPDDFPDTKTGSPGATDISKRAHGTPPNGSPPKSISPEAINAMRLIAFVSIYYVAAYSQILDLIVNRKPGYYIKDPNQYAYIVQTLTAIKAQEEQHALNANSDLNRFGAEPIQPCKYFLAPSIKDFNSAINFENILTEVFLGAGQDVATTLSKAGDTELFPALVSIIEERAEQVGWFRSINSKIAPSNPYLTGRSSDLAYSLVNQFGVVEGSCPNSNTINLTIFDTLTVVKVPLPCSGTDQIVQYSIKGSSLEVISGLVVAYVNQQNVPVLESILDPVVQGGCINFYSKFPCSSGPTFGDGLTIAVLAIGPGPFEKVADLNKVVKYGPALFEYN